MKTIPSELKNYNRRADSSITLKLDSLIELNSDDIGEIDSHLGDIAFVVLTDTLVGNEVEEKIEDIIKNLPENDTFDNHRTPSQRLRGVLYVKLQQKLNRKPTTEEFAEYYKNNMEGIISRIKESLD